MRAHGAVPATVAVLDGTPRVGLTAAELDRVCGGGLVKLSVRDLGVAVGLGRDGATTVAATAALAAAAGIAVFATGGLGGVHREARESWDVSADLAALARTPVLTVCSGVKSILDVAATLELLETSSVPVLGYRTDAFPGFYRRDSGFPVPWRVDDPAQVAAVWRAHRELGGGAGLVLAQPVPRGGRAGRGPARPAAGRRAGAGGGARHRRQGRHPRPAGALPRGQRRGEPDDQRRAGAGERGAGRAGRRRARRMNARPRVVVVGDLAVDVLVTPATAPVPGADVPARIVTAPGGAGANTAAWLAARGVDVTLVARVGDDVAGRAVVDGLAAAGVRAAVAVDPDAPTATVVVLVGPGGERTMLSDRGAAARLAAADLPPLDGVDHLHLSGYVLGAGSCAAGLAALVAARAAGASTSLDPQATGTFPADLLSRLGGVDLLLPNAAELAALTGSPEAASAVALLDVARAVVVTAGPAGASWVDRDGVRTVRALRRRCRGCHGSR